MQRIEIIGHLGNDAEIKDFNSNQVINFSVAVSETYTNKENVKVSQTTWYECAKWGNNTAIAPYLKKGTQVYISGKPSARAWQKDDGTLVSNLGITVNQIQLLGSKQENTSSSTVAPQQQNQSANTPIQQMPNENEHDDLPF